MHNHPGLTSDSGTATPDLFLRLARRGVLEAGGVVLAEGPDALMFGLARGGRKFPGFARLGSRVVQLALECAVCLPGRLAAELKRRLRPFNAARAGPGWVVRTRPEGDLACGMYTEVSLSAFTPAAFAGAVRRMRPEVLAFDAGLARLLAACEGE